MDQSEIVRFPLAVDDALTLHTEPGERLDF